MQIQRITDTQLIGVLKPNKKSRPKKAGSNNRTNGSTFDPNKDMLKLPKTKKLQLSNNGQIRYEITEADHLPVAARIA